jgi:mannose-6-phosphate isomerase-like protein (cupin superfamily)
MTSMTFETKEISENPDVMAPDGSEVRILCRMARGSMAHFTLPPGAVSIAVAHRTIEEVWHFISGRGRVGGGDRQDFSDRHVFQRPLGFQHRQGTVEALGVEDVAHAALFPRIDLS